MSKRYKIVVYARRNDQPVYSYVLFQTVKASKVWHTVYDEASSILKHETRSGMSGHVWHAGHTAIVWVGGCRFAVRAWPL